MQRQVFIVNQSCHDLTEAEKFGDIVIMSKGRYNQLATGKMYRDFEIILRDSNRLDFIVPCGRRIMSIVACSIFAKMHGRINLLVYLQPKELDGRFLPGKYKIRELVL
jgi:hypothetical protein